MVWGVLVPCAVTDTLVHTGVQLWFRSGRPFLPVMPFQVSVLLPALVLNSPSKTTAPRWSTLAVYSELLFGAQAQMTVRTYSLT